MKEFNPFNDNLIINEADSSKPSSQAMFALLILGAVVSGVIFYHYHTKLLEINEKVKKLQRVSWL
ncbi:MAG: hypothetical protein ACK452_02720 [Bacteroidota bacterium]